MKKLKLLKNLFIPFSLATLGIALPLTSCNSNQEDNKPIVYYQELSTSKEDVNNFKKEMSSLKVKQTNEGASFVEWNAIRHSIENTLNIPLDAIGMIDYMKYVDHVENTQDTTNDNWSIVLYLKPNYHWSSEFYDNGLHTTNGEDIKEDDYFIWNYALQFDFNASFNKVAIDTNTELNLLPKYIENLPVDKYYKFNEWSENGELSFSASIDKLIPGSSLGDLKVTKVTEEKESFKLDLSIKPDQNYLFKTNNSFIDSINIKNVNYSIKQFELTSSMNEEINNYINEHPFSKMTSIEDLNKTLAILNQKLKKLLGNDFYTILTIPSNLDFAWDDYSEISFALLFKGNVKVNLLVDNNFKVNSELPFVLFSNYSISTNIK